MNFIADKTMNVPGIIVIVPITKWNMAKISPEKFRVLSNIPNIVSIMPIAIKAINPYNSNFGNSLKSPVESPI